MVNTKADEEVKAIMQHLEQQDDAIIDILRRMEQSLASLPPSAVTATGIQRLRKL